MKNGHTKEAAAVLNSINNEMDITEKRTGLSGLFDRSKLPIIDKNLPDYIHAGQEHLKPTDMFVVESGRVSFEYDSHGNITGVPDVEVSEDVPPISEGGYLLGDYTDKLSEGLKSGNYRVGDIPEIKKEFLTLADKIGRELYVHADLRRGGHIQEAKAVLKNIYDTMDATERKHGVSNIFDRDMIPRL